MEDKITKDLTLRNNEYYFQQEKFNYLYKLSLQNYNFYDLIKYITDKDNIRLAYRNIKSNKGSKTCGLSGRNLTYISTMNLKVFLNFIIKQIKNYEPSPTKRVGIPKKNGKMRYLGIKEPIDKIIEQSIYQILDPIFYAKFHNNSNGFIKGRSCNRAIAQFTNYVVKEKLYYVVDIDIKGFFDNVNHSKLLKQLWTCGIKDKNLLSLISKMLKAEIENLGIPDKGTPQGGILSPLLANVVLNEFDWWLDSKKNKGVRFVRYADDVRILCPTYPVARDMLEKSTKWLNERLKLEVSEEKTKIISLKKEYMEFLGIKLKIKCVKDKVKVISNMTEQSIQKCEEKVKKQIRKIKKNKTNKQRCDEEVNYYNSVVKGIHEYYDMATNINKNLSHIDRLINKYIFKSLGDVVTYSDEVIKEDYITNKYGNGKTLPYIRGKPIIPIGRIEHKAPRYKGNKINYYDEKSIKTFHKSLELDNLFVLELIKNNPMYHESVEFNDNTLSKFCGQLGKYAITNSYIYNLSNMHIIRKINNGADKYDNIIIVESKVKKLIELKEVDDIMELYNLKKGLTRQQLNKINEIRGMNKLVLL